MQTVAYAFVLQLFAARALRAFCLRICTAAFGPPVPYVHFAYALVLQLLARPCPTCILPTRLYCSFGPPCPTQSGSDVLRAFGVRANYPTRSRFFPGNRLQRKLSFCHAGFA